MNKNEFLYFIEISNQITPVILAIGTPVIALCVGYKFFVAIENKAFLSFLEKNTDNKGKGKIPLLVRLITHLLIIMFSIIIIIMSSWFSITHITYDIHGFFPIITMAIFYEIIFSMIFLINYFGNIRKIKTFQDITYYFLGTHIVASLIVIIFASTYLRNDIYILANQDSVFPPRYIIDNFNFQLTTFSALLLTGTFIPTLKFLFQKSFSEENISLYQQQIFGLDMPKDNRDKTQIQQKTDTAKENILK